MQNSIYLIIITPKIFKKGFLKLKKKLSLNIYIYIEFLLKYKILKGFDRLIFRLVIITLKKFVFFFANFFQKIINYNEFYNLTYKYRHHTNTRKCSAEIFLKTVA